MDDGEVLGAVAKACKQIDSASVPESARSPLNRHEPRQTTQVAVIKHRSPVRQRQLIAGCGDDAIERQKQTAEDDDVSYHGSTVERAN